MEAQTINSSPESSAVLKTFADGLSLRYGDSLDGVLYYGSNLRATTPSTESLFDFMVVVSQYDEAYRRHRAQIEPPISGLRASLLKLGNRFLPPNVFYFEVEVGGQRYRAKYALLSIEHLDHYTRPNCLQPYFWGRLAQPIALIWQRDNDSKIRIEELLTQARATMLSRTLPRIDLPCDTTALWSRALEESYRSEFRAEKKQGRAQELAAYAVEHYQRATVANADALGAELTTEPDGTMVLSKTVPATRRTLSTIAWWFRRVQGRVLQIMRLVKAAWTFDAGIEYLLWKIERHSGVRVEPGPLTRRHPLLLGWLVLWKAKRKGGFK